MTITYDTLDLTLQPPLPTPLLGTSLYRDSMLVTSGGYHWGLVQTCSFVEDPFPLRVLTLAAIEAYMVGASSTHPTGVFSCNLSKIADC